ncbi:MAG TPA: hypothetical protein VG759_27660 [Candidatus Angelobacter sp.]|jgi:hypothetical protein|nr:hypothetical protein [Candidatus Angelobacter sp.]
MQKHTKPDRTRKRKELPMNKPSDAHAKKPPAQPPIEALAGQFGDAYQKLIQASHEAALHGQKQVEEAYADLAKEISNIQSDISKRHGEAYQQYIKAAQEATDQQAAQDAYKDFLETVRGLEEDSSRRASEADTGFCTKVQELTSQSHQHACENYAGYLRSIQQAWAGLDISSLT